VNKELELWQFIADRLRRDENVVLLVVAESSGSSPGRQGYKMAVGADVELCGSIGGGAMEVNLVEQSRTLLSEPPAVAGDLTSRINEQVHRKNTSNFSGMICSGKQTLIFILLTPIYADTIESIIETLQDGRRNTLLIVPNEISLEPGKPDSPNFKFIKHTDENFVYEEKLGPKNDLYIIGGGHCALAVSELMSKMDFRIHIFDDRPDLNTLRKNEFADEISVIDSYHEIGNHINDSPSAYVVVMTLGYKSDAVVMRKLINKEFRYFGVLGSKAKMATLMKELKAEGFSADKLGRIRTPIGLPINSRTPEEIAVSIAAEIIAVKNADSGS
jgi:xanthine dehydrogenase accessory factor